MISGGSQILRHSTYLSKCMVILLGLLLSPANAEINHPFTARIGQSGTVEIYHLDIPGSRVSLRLVETIRPHAASITWTEHGKQRQQYLSMPHGWWPTTRDKDIGEKLLPSAFIHIAGRQPLLVVVGQRDSGVYEYQCPMIYQYHLGQWRLVSNKTKIMEFSDRGSFCFHRRTLYIWDYMGDEDLAHMADQRYWLRELVWKHGHLSYLRTRITKHRYAGFVWDGDVGKPLDADIDPLREFALSWHWWGD